MTAERAPLSLTAPLAEVVARPAAQNPPPKHLSAARKRLWRHILARFGPLEAHTVELLRLACEALDRADEARAILAASTLVVEGRSGPRAHPAVGIERDARLAAARLLRECGFDLQDPDQTGPPSRWGGRR
jgi:phage terminase small subunit